MAGEKHKSPCHDHILYDLPEFPKIKNQTQKTSLVAKRNFTTPSQRVYIAQNVRQNIQKRVYYINAKSGHFEPFKIEFWRVFFLTPGSGKQVKTHKFGNK